MTKRTCESYEGCCGRGWICDPTDSGSGRTCYCDCAAGDRLRIEERPSPLDDVHLDYSESIHDRSEHRADEATRWDGSERGRK